MTELHIPAEFFERIHAIQEQQAREKREGSVHIGGTRDRGVCLRAYYEAARQLFREADTSGSFDVLARPILYLQRHTVELAIKSLIWDFRCVLRLDGEIKAGKLGDPPDYPYGHNLKTHSETLVATFASVSKYLEVPQALLDLAAEVVKFEAGDHSRLRYDLSARGAASFPVMLAAPVTQWQKALDELMTGPFSIREDFDTEIPFAQWTIAESLARLLYVYEHRHRKAGLSEREEIPEAELVLALDGMNEAHANLANEE